MQGNVVVLATHLDVDASEDVQRLFGNDPAASLTRLARALAASPLWAEMPEATLVVRKGPRPALAALGHFDAAARARLEALPGQLRMVLEHLRYVSYAQAERDAERLAEKLAARFGREALQDHAFVGVPRGGLVTLGLLSYALDLSHEQLSDTAVLETGRPVVIVDDCALSGARFRQVLQQDRYERVVFAPFYAAPGLRSAIEASEERVVACLSARDLHDYAPALHGDDYDDWQARWQARSPAAYWVGQPEHVCFPWNEPDVGFWNSARGQVEKGWRVVPPAHCLKNRPPAGGTPRVSVQVQPEAHGALRPAPDVLYGSLGDALIVGSTASGMSFALEGPAADMWHALVEHGSPEAACETLLAQYNTDRSTLEADLNAFADDLIEHGLLANEHAAQSVR